MKIKLTALLAAALLFTPLAIVPTGCTTSAQRITYTTLYALETGTTGAYDGFLDQVVAGKIPTTQVPPVSKAYNEFQAGMNVAIAAAQYNWQAPAPTNTTTLATAVINAIKVATGK